MTLTKYHYFFISVLSFFSVLIFRIDSFEDIIINTDEIFWLQQAKLSLQNPIPFEGFNGQTTGPLAIYLLWPLFLLKNNPSVVDIRIYGLFIIQITSFLMIYDKRNILKSIFQFLLLNSFFLINEFGFFCYNTEWITIPFILYLTKYSLSGNLYNNRIFIISSIFVCILPFIKFQNILFSIFFIFTHFQFNKNKNKLINFFSTYFCITLFIILLIYFTIGIDSLWNNYIIENLVYSKHFDSLKSFGNFSLKYKLIEFFNLCFDFFLVHILISLFFFIIYIKYSKSRFPFFFLRRKNYFIFLFVGFLSVFAPRTNFDHYFIFMFIPFFSVISLFFDVFPKYKYYLILIFVLFNIPSLQFANEYAFNVFSGKTHTNRILNSGKIWSVDRKIKMFVKNKIKESDNILYLGSPLDHIFYYTFGKNNNQLKGFFIFSALEAYNNNNRNIPKDVYKIFIKYQDALYKNLSSKPYIIFDFHMNLNKYSDERINNFLKNNYIRRMFIHKNHKFYYFEYKTFKLNN